MSVSPSTSFLSLKKTREYLEKYKFYPQKRLGQHFLIDQNINTIIKNALHLQKEESVFEIGTGLGSLTLALIPAVQHVFSIEKDTRLKPILDEILSNYSNSVTVLYQDILTFDLVNFLNQKEQEGYRIEKLVGNLPYSISLPLLRKIIEMRGIFKLAVIMIQKEVAERMLAQPGNKNYGLLSVISNYYANMKKIHLVKPGAFFPKPEVESLLIRISFLTKPNVHVPDEALFFDVARAIFQHRRKNLSNALRLYFAEKLEKNVLERVLAEVKLNPNQRGETLSIKELALLTEAIKHIKDTSGLKD